MYTILQSDGGKSHTPKNAAEIYGIYCIIISCVLRKQKLNHHHQPLASN
jgi:hypothetical protein